MSNYRQLLIKVLLVFIAEAVAFTLIYSFTRYIHPLANATLIHVVFGAILAVVVVSLYNRRLQKKKEKVESELQDLTTVVLKKIPDEQEEDRK
jgi:positive regulator of sigma E activity